MPKKNFDYQMPMHGQDGAHRTELDEYGNPIYYDHNGNPIHPQHLAHGAPAYGHFPHAEHDMHQIAHHLQHYGVGHDSICLLYTSPSPRD